MRYTNRIVLFLILACLTSSPVSGLNLSEVIPSAHRELSLKEIHNLNVPQNYKIQDVETINDLAFAMIGSVQSQNQRSYGWIRIYSQFHLINEFIIGDLVNQSNGNNFDLIETDLLSVQAYENQLFVLGNTYFKDLADGSYYNSSILLRLNAWDQMIKFSNFTFYPNYRAISAQLIQSTQFNQSTFQYENIGYTYYMVQENLLSSSGLPTTMSLLIYNKGSGGHIYGGPYLFEKTLNKHTIGFAPLQNQMLYFQLNTKGQVQGTGLYNNVDLNGTYVTGNEFTGSDIDVGSLRDSAILVEYGSSENQIIFSITSFSPNLDRVNWAYQLPSLPVSHFKLLTSNDAAYLSYTSYENGQYILNALLVLGDGTLSSSVMLKDYYAIDAFQSGKNEIVIASKHGEANALVFKEKLQYPLDQAINALVEIFTGQNLLGKILLLALVLMTMYKIWKKKSRHVSEELYPVED